MVLLLSTLHTTMDTVNVSVHQGHSSQLATISSIAAKDLHPWESQQHKLEEISELPVALTSLHTSRFFSSCSTAFDTCKTALIYLNTYGNDF